MVRNIPKVERPANRPLIAIDWNIVDKYLISDCSGTEIAGLLGCSADTIYQRCEQEKGKTFSAYAAEKKAKGDSLLRDKQYTVALEGDKTMLVWLGKNRLKQKETETPTVSETANLQFTALMNQIQMLQSALKIAESKSNDEAKS